MLNENHKNLLAKRLEAAVMAFALAHKLDLKGDVLKWDEWSSKKTLDIFLRIEIDSHKDDPHDAAI